MSTFPKFIFSFTLCLLWHLTQATPGQAQFLFNRFYPNTAIDHLQQQLAKLPAKDNQWVLLTIELSDLCRLFTCAETDASHHDAAQQYAQQAVDQARLLKDPVLLAKALNALGNVLIQDQSYEEAEKCYQQALNLLQATTQPQLSANILVNQAQWRVALLSSPIKYQNAPPVTFEGMKSIWQNALVATQQLPAGRARAELMIHFGQMADDLLNPKTLPELPEEEKTSLRHSAYSLLQEVQKLDASQFPREVSYANGLLSAWYQQAGREKEAESLLRQAIFYAQRDQAYDILYLWELQLGRLFKAKGDIQTAIMVYQLARSSLDPKRYMRFQLVTSRYRNRTSARTSAFRETPAGQVYLELFELLSHSARQSPSESERQQKLKEAREVLEDFKQGELENYFQDDCTNPNQSDPPKDSSDQGKDWNIDKNVAVLYPIVFDDRVELLLQTPPAQFKLLPPWNITRSKLEWLVKGAMTKLNANPAQFDQNAEKSRENENKLREVLAKLYQSLIRPVEMDIVSLDTLVIIPDGILRILPFAALYDGKQYLAEKKQLVTTTALRLIDNSATKSSSPSMLLGGLTEGENRLDYARKELEAIQKWFPPHSVSILQDKEFTKANFLEKVERQSYSLIHLASHGKFTGRMEESSLKTTESFLKINDFKNLAYWGDYRNSPVELLTLSACETSSGDEDAALGMSGLTVVSGAKTVVGSLWKVDDLSTCYLMEAFYRQYASGVPKAKALQEAQLQLLKGNTDMTRSVCGEGESLTSYQHPYYWAGFWVIGNWQ